MKNSSVNPLTDLPVHRNGHNGYQKLATTGDADSNTVSFDKRTKGLNPNNLKWASCGCSVCMKTYDVYSLTARRRATPTDMHSIGRILGGTTHFCRVPHAHIERRQLGEKMLSTRSGQRHTLSENVTKQVFCLQMVNATPSCSRVLGFQKCDEETVETWIACDAEDSGFQMVNDDEIGTSVQETYDETDEDEYNNNNESSKSTSKADTFSALEIALKGYEQQSECCPNQLQLLKRIIEIKAKKRSTRFHILPGSLSDIRTIAYPNGVRSQLIRINNDVLL
ncbi:uncharacterized protein TNCV_316031 [Trichonephila clavipes]|nr:uncharacterized protein TNCV_316031 [Trichonephila clavipes]